MGLGYGFSMNPNCHYGDHDFEDEGCVHCQTPVYEEPIEPYDHAPDYNQILEAFEKYGTNRLYWDMLIGEWVPVDNA